MSEDCIFCKIIKGEIPSSKIYEDKSFIAFKDINPAAPFHTLVVPKDHRASLNEYEDADKKLLGDLLLTAKKIAKEAGIDSYRTVINTGAQACQSVFHLHLHIISGRKLEWVH